MSDALARIDGGPLTANEIKAHVQLIQEVMQAVMKKDVHYGTIPGTPKPTLYKAGAEKILSTFGIAAYPKEVDDLSTGDEIRYRVKVHGINIQTGNLIGVGIGEASSNEEKYKWRKPVCNEEWDDTPVDRRREVWKKGGSGPYKMKQVRMNPADIANTILKMAKKRGLIDLTLTATAASDAFEQDLEDMTDEVREGLTGDRPEAKPPLTPPRSTPAETPRPGGKRVISEPQARRFRTKCDMSGKKDYHPKLKEYGFEHSGEITLDVYDELCAWADSK